MGCLGERGWLTVSFVNLGRISGRSAVTALGALQKPQTFLCAEAVALAEEGGVDYSGAATLSVPQLPLTDPGLLGPSTNSSRVPLLFPSSRKQGPAPSAFRCPLFSSSLARSLCVAIWRRKWSPPLLQTARAWCRYRRPKSGWRRRCEW